MPFSLQLPWLRVDTHCSAVMLTSGTFVSVCWNSRLSFAIATIHHWSINGSYGLRVQAEDLFSHLPPVLLLSSHEQGLVDDSLLPSKDKHIFGRAKVELGLKIVRHLLVDYFGWRVASPDAHSLIGMSTWGRWVSSIDVGDWFMQGFVYSDGNPFLWG